MNDLYMAIRPGDTKGLLIGLGSTQTPMSGFYATIMQWVKCFLTTPGTDLSDPAYGTRAAGLIGGNYSDSNYIRDVVTTSVATATATIQSYQAGQGLADADRLSGVQVSNLNIGPGQVDIYLTFTNMAGASVTIPVTA
jgi:hypothetical protein